MGKQVSSAVLLMLCFVGCQQQGGSTQSQQRVPNSQKELQFAPVKELEGALSSGTLVFARLPADHECPIDDAPWLRQVCEELRPLDGARPQQLLYIYRGDVADGSLPDGFVGLAFFSVPTVGPEFLESARSVGRQFVERRLRIVGNNLTSCDSLGIQYDDVQMPTDDTVWTGVRIRTVFSRGDVRGHAAVYVLCRQWKSRTIAIVTARLVHFDLDWVSDSAMRSIKSIE
jgi:hypothetical protein